MIGAALTRVVAGESLSAEDMQGLVRDLMTGELDERLAAALLAALRTRGEQLSEIVGAARAALELALPVRAAPEGAVDTCGTGGDGSGTFNISTAAALVVAAAGTPVAKHGNRRATSRCGSADVLEALGVALDLSPEQMAECVHRVGIGFLFARACHPAFAVVGPLRAALPIPTLFNRLGPLINPTRPRRHLVGVGSVDQMELTIHALAELGAERAWVVSSHDGLDELSTSAPTEVCTFHRAKGGSNGEGRFDRFVVEPGKLVPLASLSDLAGGDAPENAERIRRLLAGEPGPARDVVLLNAAGALCAAGHRDAPDLESGVALAARAIDSGAARELLARWIEHCRAARQGDGA